MAYRAVVEFTDIKDNNHVYKAGDTFPRLGLKVTEDCIRGLLTPARRTGQAFIEQIPVNDVSASVSRREALQKTEYKKPVARPRKGRRQNAD